MPADAEDCGPQRLLDMLAHPPVCTAIVHVIGSELHTHTHTNLYFKINIHSTYVYTCVGIVKVKRKQAVYTCQGSPVILFLKVTDGDEPSSTSNGKLVLYTNTQRYTLTLHSQ